ncbi:MULTISPECIES: bifunctional DNA primase/polymerase [Amycolatopsis]|uniref:Bifunctional DNA primase/polymerase n=1 Tax=Amycolatopsis albidoflavus TaxID=102226 RepID=A0ABW5HT27_9PSEU
MHRSRIHSAPPIRPDLPFPAIEGPRRLLAAALWCAARGWAVFPLKAGGKIPAIEGWQRWATRDAATIVGWWRRHPADNVGIACGPSDLVVLDLDDPRGQRARNGPHGREVLSDLARQAGLPDPVATFTVATPGNDGNEHRFFRQPPDQCLRSSVGTSKRGLGRGVDTRGHGGLVVAPGSLVDRNGDPLPYKVIRDLPVAPLPRWLVDRLTPPPPPAVVPQQRVPDAADPRIAAYVRAAVAGEVQRVRTAEVGGRHEAVLSAARSLGQLAANGWITDTDIAQHLVDAARRHLGVEEFTWSELTAAIDDGIAYGRQLPRVIRTR